MTTVWLHEVTTMERTLREHIEGLQQKLQTLTAQLMEEEPGKLRARGELESQLRALESALTLYRSAFEIEERLSKPQKPLPDA
jgi:hypothetical protein